MIMTIRHGVALSALLVSLTSAAAPLQPFVADSYQQIIAVNQQQPMLLVLWSLDCPPCREEMPELAEFVAQRSDIKLVMVSVDGVEAAEEVEAVLADNQLNAENNWIFADSYVEKLRFKVDPGWRGELPRSYLYVPGEQRHRIRGRIDFTAMEKYLAALEK